jgi:flap endonuclease-1
MGVKKLHTFLNNKGIYKTYPYLNNLIEELNLDKNKIIIGVDANLFYYKYSHSYDNMLIGFFNQVLKFLSYGYYPLYIFDGGTMTEKENTNLLRTKKKNNNEVRLNMIEEELTTLEHTENNYDLQNLMILKKKIKKNTIKISTEEIKKILELFDLLNIPYIFSAGEGEYLAVLLNNYKIIDLFLTDDTDPIPAGIDYLIKFTNNLVMFLDKKTILDKLELTKEQLCDLSILLGSDYSDLNFNKKSILKPDEIYDLIKRYNNIENICNNIVIDKKLNTDMNNLLSTTTKIREIYNKSPLYEKKLIIDPDSIIDTYNIISIHKNIDYFSNVLLEYWDELINIFKYDYNEKVVNNYKINIINFIKSKKININNIIKFLKFNINDLSNDEIINIISSFSFLDNK